MVQVETELIALGEMMMIQMVVESYQLQQVHMNTYIGIENILAQQHLI